MRSLVSTIIFLFVILIVCFSCKNDNADSAENKNPVLTDTIPADVTFTSHIANIIYTNCTPCHRQGKSGPFPYESFADIRKKAKMINFVVSDGFMPPWPADRSYRHFAYERGLTDYEIKLIQAWYKNGAVYGDTATAPIMPDYSDYKVLGEPDLVLKLQSPFQIRGNNKDQFYMMKIPWEIPEDTFIRMIEFIPDNEELLHHINGHLIFYEEGAKADVFEGVAFLDNEGEGDAIWKHKKLGILNDDGSHPLLTPSVVNYLPGAISTLYPEGIGGWRMTRKGALYLNDIHFGPSPVDASDQSTFNIYYANAPPKRKIQELILGTLGKSEIVPPLHILPDSIMTFKTQYQIGKDISLLTVNPHMHLLGKYFIAYAVTPEGDTIPIIRIPEWDFRWQFFYTFKHMIKIPAGSKIVAEAIFDNTVNNPNNPFDPPRLISDEQVSMRTSDEMFQLILNYLIYEAGDENISLEQQ